MNDVEPDVQRFLDYVNGIISNDEFVQEIDQTIKKEKADQSKGMTYMTYEMKIKEERKEAERIGERRKELEMVTNLLRNKVSIPIIASVSGLTIDKIKAIAKDNHIEVSC
ncbi:hypothetical protein [uncultured Dialister sp.]|uniref:hypothetical protein n=1 Tax=uncultured Dialister sp. TaxID=278064 RepID=UPI00260140BD|nr:hypothetical protein [uncultured Dialister sp.]